MSDLDTVELHIILAGSESFAVAVTDKSTVGEVRAEVASKAGATPSSVLLVFCGEALLIDDEYIVDYELDGATALNAFVRGAKVAKRASIDLHIITPLTTLSVGVEPDSTIAHVRALVAKKLNVKNAASVLIVFCGEPLEASDDEQTVEDVGLDSATAVNVFIKGAKVARPGARSATAAAGASEPPRAPPAAAKPAAVSRLASDGSARSQASMMEKAKSWGQREAHAHSPEESKAIALQIFDDMASDAGTVSCSEFTMMVRAPLLSAVADLVKGVPTRLPAAIVGVANEVRASVLEGIPRIQASIPALAASLFRFFDAVGLFYLPLHFKRILLTI